MAGRRFLGAGLLVLALAAMTLPVGAVPPAAADDPWVVWVASDGTYGVSRSSDLARTHGLADNHQPGFQHCYGTSPLENTCTLQAYIKPYPAIFLTGWAPPTIAPTGYVPYNGAVGAFGALVASTHLEMTGDMFPDTKILLDCTWATPGFYGSEIPVAPFLACRPTYIYPEGAPLSERYPRGNVTVNFWNGGYDPSIIDPLLPSTASLAPGVGTWHAILYVVP
ncbi:MAG TPA: hypothetical protein VGR28_05315 [Candidatus Thermoplasmatota archaeon]|nr:hypothetical protein [Candidatus Thermoplasmatota archaeon]